MSVEATGSIAYLGAARFQGYWNASTNAATGSGLSGAASGPFTVLLINNGYNDGTNITASAGDYWQVTGSGTTTINGETNWNVNDWAIYSGSASGAYESGKWLKLNFEDTIASIIIGDLSSSSFHMGIEHDKHIIFDSGSVHHGTESFTYDYTTSKLFLSGAMFVSGTGVDITGPQGASAVLTLRADQGDDATDTTTITVANGGITTIASGADLVLDPGGNNVLPGGDSADDLGADGTAWRKLYVDDIDLNGVGRIDLDVDADTSIRSSAEDTLNIEVGGVDLLTMISASAGPSTQITGALFVSGSGLTLTGPQGGSAILTFKADQGDDAADTATLAVANSGATQLTAASITMFTNAFNVGTDTDNDVAVTFKGNSSDGVITWMEDEDHFQFADEILIEDDKKIYFGNLPDASIEYDEDGTNKLIISGAAGGFNIDLPDNAVDAFTVTQDNNSYITVTTLNGTETISLYENTKIYDDKKLYFGNLPDASIEYDEDGTDSLIISGSVGGGLVLSGSKLVLGSQMVSDTAIAVAADSIPFFDADGTLKRDTIVDLAAGMAGTGLDASSGQLTVDLSEVIASDAANEVLTSDGDGTATGEANLTFDGSSLFVTGNIRVADDKNIYFGGPGEDALIRYQETGDNFLYISGSSAGTAISGTTVKLDATSDIQLYAPSITIGRGTSSPPDPVLKFAGDTNTGQVTWLEDEDRFGFSDDIVLYDDKKFWFGSGPSGGESYIVYRETGDDFLVISGSSAGTAISGTTVTISATNTHLKTAAGPAYAVITAGGLVPATAGAFDLGGAGSNNQLGDVFIADDKKVIFGAGSDANIHYRETGDDFLVISGSSAGTAISGTTVTISATNTHLKTAAGPAYAVITAGGLVPATAGAFNLGGGGSGNQLGNVYIADDKKILFGVAGDASMEYDEDGTDKLLISGAAGGFNIDLPDNVANAFSIGEEANPYMTVVTSNSAEAVMFSKDTWIIDDKKLYFGTGKDASIEYDEDGNDLLTFAGADVSFAGLVNVGTGIEITANEADTITATGGGAVTAGAVSQSARKGVITIDLATNSCNIANMATYTVTLTNAACDVDSVIAVTTTGVMLANSHTLSGGGCKFAVTNSTGGAITANFTINYVIL